MECLAGNDMDGDEVNLNNRNITSLSSALSFSPYLAKLFLQENNSLTMIPPYFFQHIPVLLVLDLSHTSIQSLPPSISRLYLLEKLILQECSLLMEVPPEVGALKNLKLFDLEGTELMYLPKQIGKLETLERFRVSLSACADDQKDRYGVQYIIPRMMISKLSKLKELSISVDPEAEWWEVELLEAIMRDLPFLPEIETLKLYLPTAKALQQFLRLERFRVPIYSSLWNYRFMIGHCEKLPFSVQLNIEESFLKLEKCVKYMNGEGYTNETVELIRDAKALYLRRHWTAEKLSVFDIRRLKYCLLMECNELQTLVDQGDLYKHKNRSTSHSEDEILGSLQYLSIHFMKKLQRISKGRIGRHSLSCLRILALHTCPELTSIFTGCLLGNMQSLTELIVEDCPKVKCLVDLGEVTPCGNGPFLLSLRMVSLIDLPELVSISSGVCIAPQLDTLLIFNCMKLNYLSVKEIPRGTKAIKGEIEWWGALKYGKLTWHDVFVQLKSDGGLMDQLAEDTNSLKHFLDLEMIPSHHGSSSHVDQNSLTELHLGCNCVSTKEDLEHVVPLHIDSLPSPNEIQKTEDTDCDMKAVNHQLASAKKRHRSISIVTSKRLVKVSKGIEVEIALDDGYLWRKYGQKDILGSQYPRSFYRCGFRTADGCKARKQVQRSTGDPSVFEVYYSGVHTCPTKLRNNFSSTETVATCKTFRTRGSPNAIESASTITDNHFDDGYVWTKYGNRKILGGEISKTESGTFMDGDLLVNRDGVRIVSQSQSETPPLIQPSDNQLSLADFDAVKVVGKGNGGIVRLVQHKWTGQFFALKVIQMNVEESARRQIAQELKINQSSECTNVVVCYQSFYDNGAVSIILEYMDGGSLADFLKTVQSIPEPNLAAICKQVLKGLWYLHHEKHIIHRDLKPSNLLINHRGEVKITDFGVSAILASTSGLANTFVGTYNYMSPERIIGGKYDYKSDTWSLGLVLLECATGHFPYSPPQPGEGWVNVYELMQTIVSQPPPRASPEQFSPQFCSFIEACVQKDPKDRASANELMSHPFINMFDDMAVDLASYFAEAGSLLQHCNESLIAR